MGLELRGFMGIAYYNDPTSGALRSMNMSAFDATNTYIKHFNANIVYTLLPGTASTAKNANGQGIWWNFHNVAVAGIHPTTGLVYVADPDSNLGPSVANAGWPHTNANFPAAAPFSLTSAAGSPRPVPAAPNVATPRSWTRRPIPRSSARRPPTRERFSPRPPSLPRIRWGIS